MRSRRLVEVARLKRAMGGFFCCPQDGTVPVLVLVPGHKYPKTGIKEIYGKTSVRVCAPIQMIPLHFRVLMAWDKYSTVGYGTRVEGECGYYMIQVLYDSLRNACFPFVTAASEEKI